MSSVNPLRNTINSFAVAEPNECDHIIGFLVHNFPKDLLVSEFHYSTSPSSKKSKHESTDSMNSMDSMDDDSLTSCSPFVMMLYGMFDTVLKLICADKLYDILSGSSSDDTKRMFSFLVSRGCYTQLLFLLEHGCDAKCFDL